MKNQDEKSSRDVIQMFELLEQEFIDFLLTKTYLLLKIVVTKKSLIFF